MKKATLSTIGLSFVLTVPLAGQGLPSHDTFADVLQRYLENQLVDYAALQSNRAELDGYITELGATAMSAVEQAPQNAQLAFWINAYNACTMRLVVDNYPFEKPGLFTRVINSVKGYPSNSIQQVPDTWKRKFCSVAGQERSLDDIEHGIIRPMGEPRIHFAVNCASRSCPALAATPYTADSLDAQLDAAVATFVSDVRQYELERGDNAVIHLNKVLDWYQDDFGGVDGVVTFLLPHLPPADAAYIQEHAVKRVSFRDYDWTLNDTAVFGSTSER